MGLVKNLALQALVSVGSNSQVVKQFLVESCGVKELMQVMVEENKRVIDRTKKKEPTSTRRLTRQAKVEALEKNLRDKESLNLHRYLECIILRRSLSRSLFVAFLM